MGGWVSGGVQTGKILCDPRRTGRAGRAAAKARPAASPGWGWRALKETGSHLERVFCGREARGSGRAGKRDGGWGSARPPQNLVRGTRRIRRENPRGDRAGDAIVERTEHPANEVPRKEWSVKYFLFPEKLHACVSTKDGNATDPHARDARDFLDHACCAAPLRASCVRLERRAREDEAKRILVRSFLGTGW